MFQDDSMQLARIVGYQPLDFFGLTPDLQDKFLY